MGPWYSKCETCSFITNGSYCRHWYVETPTAIKANVRRACARGKFRVDVGGEADLSTEKADGWSNRKVFTTVALISRLFLDVFWIRIIYECPWSTILYIRWCNCLRLFDNFVLIVLCINYTIIIINDICVDSALITSLIEKLVLWEKEEQEERTLLRLNVVGGRTTILQLRYRSENISCLLAGPFYLARRKDASLLMTSHLPGVIHTYAMDL